MPSMLDDSYYLSPHHDQRINDANNVYEEMRQVNLDFNPKHRNNEEEEENDDEGNYMEIQRRDRLYSHSTEKDASRQNRYNYLEKNSKHKLLFFNSFSNNNLRLLLFYFGEFGGSYLYI